MKFSLICMVAAANAATTITDTVAKLCDQTDDALSITVDSSNLHDTSLASGQGIFKTTSC